VSVVDPDGREPITIATAILIGALIGGGTYTAGVATSNGGFNNWKWGQFATSVGLGAINGALGNINPLSIDLGHGFKFALAPQLAVGTDGLGIGLNASLGYQNKGLNLGLNAGGSYYASATGTGNSGFEGRFGYGASYQFGKKFYIGTGFNHFASGETSQQTWYATTGKNKDYNYTFDNDIAGDGGDRYRTAGNVFKFGNNDVGLLMFTGDPGLNGDSRLAKNGYYVNKNGNDPDKYRFGGLYYGRRINNKSNPCCRWYVFYGPFRPKKTTNGRLMYIKSHILQ
jgi:hypothetical protein